MNVGSVACRLTGCRLLGIGLVTVGSLNVGSVTGTLSAVDFIVSEVRDNFQRRLLIQHFNNLLMRNFQKPISKALEFDIFKQGNSPSATNHAPIFNNPYWKCSYIPQLLAYSRCWEYSILLKLCNKTSEICSL